VTVHADPIVQRHALRRPRGQVMDQQFHIPPPRLIMNPRRNRRDQQRIADEKRPLILKPAPTPIVRKRKHPVRRRSESHVHAYKDKQQEAGQTLVRFHAE